MSGGEGLRARSCFPHPSVTGSDAREACQWGEAAAGAFFPGGSPEALGQQEFQWMAALN